MVDQLLLSMGVFEFCLYYFKSVLSLLGKILPYIG